MKLSKVINLLWDRQAASGGPLSEYEVSQPSSSRLLSSQQQIALIRQPGGWPAGIGEKIISTLVRLPHWPAMRTISVNEDHCEICRYGAGGRIAESSGPQDIMLVHTAGYYQSVGEFYAKSKPDGDSLFRAVVYGLGENIYANSTDITQQMLTWRHRVADGLLEQERDQSFLAGATETPGGMENVAWRREKRRGSMDINHAAPTAKRSANYTELQLRHDPAVCPGKDKEIYKIQFAKILKNFELVIYRLRRPQTAITQNKVAELEISLLSLYDTITDKTVRNYLKKLLHTLNIEVNASQRGLALNLYLRLPGCVTMPQITKTPLPQDTATRVYRLPQPERWPVADAAIQRQQFPDITICFLRIIEAVEKQKILLPRQIDKLETRLWFLYYQLQSALAKNDVSRSLHELQEILSSTGEGLKLSFLPLYVYKGTEFSLATKYVDLTPQKFQKKNLSSWTAEDRIKQQEIFPSFIKNLSVVRTVLKKHDEHNHQKQINLFESKLLHLYQQVSGQQAQSDIENVFCEVKEIIRLSGKGLSSGPLPGDIARRKNPLSYGSAAQSPWAPASQQPRPGVILSGYGMEAISMGENFTQEKIDRWPKFDQHKQRVLFSDIVGKFIFIKEKLRQSHEYFYQQWINVFANRVLVLYPEVVSQRAKDDIVCLLCELEEMIQQSGRGLVLQQPQGMTENGGNTLFSQSMRQVQQGSSASHTVTLSESERYPVREAIASWNGPDPQAESEPEALSEVEGVIDLSVGAARGGASATTAEHTRGGRKFAGSRQ